jgi:hypothetical protein
MTSTTPLRRITRQRSHIGFTDARTFIGPSLGRIEQKLREKARMSQELDAQTQIGPRADVEI